MNPEGKVRIPFGQSGLKPGKNLTQLLAEARLEALEEAAQVCEEISRKWAESGSARNACVVNTCHIRIRELKDKEQ